MSLVLLPQMMIIFVDRANHAHPNAIAAGSSESRAPVAPFGPNYVATTVAVPPWAKGAHCVHL